MADRPPKRARASSNAGTSPAIPNPERLAQLPKLLDTLNEKTVRTVLLSAAQESSAVAALIEAESARLAKAESAKTIDFGYHSKSIWRTLNVEYTKGIKSSRQFEMSGDAYWSVVGEIKDIKARCPAHASYGTKFSALETLRKIGKIILLSKTSTLGHEIHKSFGTDSILEDTIYEIVESMTEQEREEIMAEPQGDDGFWFDKFEELVELAAEYCIFEGLKDVTCLLLEEDNSDDDNSTGTSDGEVEIVDMTSD